MVTTNYNELGANYTMAAMPFSWRGFKILGDSTVDHCKEVQQMGADHLPDVLRADGRPASLFFQRLDAVLYQARRMSLIVDDMVQKFTMTMREHKPPLVLAVSPPEVTFEAESVLFKTAACLDATAKYLSLTINGFRLVDGKGRPQTVYFSNLANGLKAALTTDSRAKDILSLLAEVQPHLSELLLSVGRKTMRNFAAHEGTIEDLAGSTFAMTWLEDGRFLRFDQDVYERPLIGSIINMVGATTYFIYQLARILVTTSPNIKIDVDTSLRLTKPIDFYAPIWRNPLLSWRRFETNSPGSLEFTMWLFHKAGVVMNNVHLDPSVLAHATPD